MSQPLPSSLSPEFSTNGNKVPCRACRKWIDPGDAFCRHCGCRQAQSASWMYQPLWIIVLTLTVLGPFSLPLVWRSPVLSRQGKVALSLGIVLLTILVCLILYQLTLLVIPYWRELSDQLGQLG